MRTRTREPHGPGDHTGEHLLLRETQRGERGGGGGGGVGDSIDQAMGCSSLHPSGLDRSAPSYGNLGHLAPESPVLVDKSRSGLSACGGPWRKRREQNKKMSSCSPGGWGRFDRFWNLFCAEPYTSILLRPEVSFGLFQISTSSCLGPVHAAGSRSRAWVLPPSSQC